MSATGSLLTSLECRACCTQVEPDHLVGTCPTCGHALLAVYDLSRLDARGWWSSLAARPRNLWRYRELLPVRDSEKVITLGEGFTPTLSLAEAPEAPGVRLLLKDDGLIPTGSFKARGMAVAVSRAVELGAAALFAPSAGNAAIALAAYGARARIPVRVYLPDRNTAGVQEVCRRYGAEVTAVPGTIRDAGEAGRTAEKGRGSFDMSTLREPYRVEGKKTMGLEIVEQAGEQGFPDAVVYPTGGGTGLVGMYKAFQELRTLGLCERIPRLYAVQPDGCAPVVQALRDDAPRVTPWADPHTVAPGLLVPAPFASERILEALRGSHGGGATVTDGELVDAMGDLARRHGVSSSPEAAATYAALPHLVHQGAIHSDETVLLYNTGTGLSFSTEELRRAATGRRGEDPAAPRA
ncbi:MAG TPA: threonine synthase [Thermoplasmata archaeon]|nr:threonine synthase [Thermoplasmata archaeon]